MFLIQSQNVLFGWETEARFKKNASRRRLFSSIDTVKTPNEGEASIHRVEKFFTC